jgi:hypothetical protein
MSQSFTFIDVAGNQAQYTIYEKDRRDEFYWSTEHGDHGTEPTYSRAQERARTILKESMAVRRSAQQDRRRF